MEKPKRGTYVSRAAYQRLKEENRKLLLDLQSLCAPSCGNDEQETEEFIKVFNKWSDFFYKNQRFRQMLQDFAKIWLKEHPEDDIKSPKFNPNKSITKNESKNN
jgi:hypothetical protein